MDIFDCTIYELFGVKNPLKVDLKWSNLDCEEEWIFLALKDGEGRVYVLETHMSEKTQSALGEIPESLGFIPGFMGKLRGMYPEVEVSFR